MSLIISRERLKALYPQWEPRIPEIHIAPTYDRVLAWRISEEEKTKSGIILTADTTLFRGRVLLLACGLKAGDDFYDHDILLGDICAHAEFAGNDKMVVHSREGQATSFLWLTSGDILGSETLIERIKRGDTKVAQNDEDRYYIVRGGSSTISPSTTMTLDPNGVADRI